MIVMQDTNNSSRKINYMKLKYHSILFTLLLAFSIPSGIALAFINDNLQVQLVTPFGGDPNQGVVNGLNDVSNAIRAQTQALQDAQIQQKIDALDQACVKQVTEYINAKDAYIKSIDKTIEDIQNNYRNTKDMSDPKNINDMNSQLNYLYTLRGRQSKYYKQLIIENCLDYKAPLKCSGDLVLNKN